MTDLIFADRILPDGKHVLIPVLRLPRTCERADGIRKIAYHTRKDARRARTKHHHAYRCPNCAAFHLASDK